MAAKKKKVCKFGRVKRGPRKGQCRKTKRPRCKNGVNKRTGLCKKKRSR